MSDLDIKHNSKDGAGDSAFIENAAGRERPLASLNALGGETAHVTDPAAERRIVWKFDLRLLPILAVMYLFK